MPAIGLGTFGSDHVSPDEIAEAVQGAVEVGYRHFDCASVYGNEDRIGRALARSVSHGVRREELWITSKLWNDKHGEDDVIPSCRQVARRPAARLPRHVPGALAVSELSSAGLHGGVAQPGTRSRTSTRTS